MIIVLGYIQTIAQVADVVLAVAIISIMVSSRSNFFDF